MVIADYISDKKNIVRLNSRIFRIFELGLGYWNLDSLDCRACKIISHDTNLGMWTRRDKLFVYYT